MRAARVARQRKDTQKNDPSASRTIDVCRPTIIRGDRHRRTDDLSINHAVTRMQATTWREAMSAVAASDDQNDRDEQ